MVQPGTRGRPLPWPNEFTRPFFDAAREGRFVLPRCPRDGFFYYPRSHCPTCLGRDWSFEPASGRGTVHAFTIDRVGHTPGLESEAPYVVAIVELAEGPRMTARIRGCPPEDVHVGQPVAVSFEAAGDVAIPIFRPA